MLDACTYFRWFSIEINASSCQLKSLGFSRRIFLLYISDILFCQRLTMVRTRGKKKTASSNRTLEANEAAENALAERQTSDSLTVNVEEPKADGQFEDKAEIPVDETGNEKYEEMSGEEESEKVTKVDNNDENTMMTEMNGDNKAESEQNTSEDDEIDDQEDLMWEDEEENSEEIVVYEDEVSEEEATEEEDDDEDEVSVEEAIEEEYDDEDEVSEEEATEIAKVDGREAEAKEDGKEAEEHNGEKVEVSLKSIKKSSERSRKKKVRAEWSKKVDSGDKPESSRKRKVKKRVESMGMIFLCSSKTKNDCYQYRVLGLPESKKNIVEKIYIGMRLFLYDLDLKLMYGIYKAAGRGGYNIEPKAFKSQFPSQVRFTVLDDCLPLPEEKFKKVIKENYFTKTKFDCQLNSEQVKELCKLFIVSSKGHRLKKLGRSRKAEKHHPVRRERTRRQRAGDERRLALREELRYHERPRKRLRNAISPEAPLRQPLPAPLPSTVPSYVYERTSDVDAYRRDQYLESHNLYRDRHDPLVIRRDPYRDGRDPPTERRDHYRDGRDTYLVRHYPYRDGRDPYIERRDTYRDGRDPSPRRRDPYTDGRDSYLERRDPYRDRRDPHIEIHNSYRDGRDSYLERRVPYRDATHSEPYSTYRRDPLSDRPDVYREDQGVEYHDSYRREELLERRDLHPFNLETRHRHDIGSRDSYASDRERPPYAEPIYSAEYPSRAGLAREYRL
ncbi:hypothetical protein Pfo_007048 [Paulownia fortunei]|nr:hypothetical protein Pfo_007048 [Paulownia fortunei]